MTAKKKCKWCGRDLHLATPEYLGRLLVHGHGLTIPERLGYLRAHVAFLLAGLLGVCPTCPLAERLLSATSVEEVRQIVAEGRKAQPSEARPAARIRAAYMKITGGKLNEYVRLAVLRAQLPNESREAVDKELRALQQAGTVVLYPIDDPQRLRREDDAAAIRVSGERRDLVLFSQ